MSLTVTSNYTTENNKKARTPVYKVAFSGVSQTYSTHKLGTSHPYMSLPTGTASTVTPDTGQSTIGSITFTLYDNDGEATALVAGGLGGKTVTFYGGFDGLAEADFATFFTGVVNSVRMTRDLTGYEITVTDLQTLTNKQLFQAYSTSLSSALIAAATDTWDHYWNVTAPPGSFEVHGVAQDPTAYGLILDGVYGAGNWAYTSNVHNDGLHISCSNSSSFPSSGYVLIDNEIIQYSANSANVLTVSSRAALGTTLAAHTSGTTVQQLIRLYGHPIDLFQSCLTNTDNTGLSISTANIDTTALTALKTTIGASYNMEFRITEAVNAKTFFEDEIFKPLACYLIITGAGKISARQFAAPTSAVATLSHDNIIGSDNLPEMTWDANFSSIINSVQFYFDYNPQTDTYATTSAKTSDATSIARYGEYPMVIYSKGFRSALSGTTTLQAAIAALILARYASGGAPKVTLKVFLSQNLIEPGDIVSITSALLPNKTTATRGISGSLFEVISRANVFDEGQVELELLWTSWN